jgi:shikimate dehydrogenase
VSAPALPDRYALMGHPVSHSKSPRIHSWFAEQTGQSLSYHAMDVEPGHFAREVRDFFAAGGAGLNVTVPYKEEAWQLAEVRSEMAETAGAVNVLFRNEHGQLCGDNTDGIGLVRDLVDNNAGTITGRRLLILGAGGAVRGALAALVAQRPACVVIANRTLAKAEQLAQLFHDKAEISATTYEALSQPFDLIINGTSAGLHGQMPALPADVLGADTWCYDMMYSEKGTVFQHWAEHHGAAVALDGTGMLVEQAAEAFHIWRGVRPLTAPVLEKLRAGFA